MLRLLLPLSWIYAAIMGIRNMLFDKGVLKQTACGVPSICVGNLAVGGTGKTPHTEYLLRLLAAQGLRTAMLSRGYGRRTKGFIEATAASTGAEVGDEPLQVKQKFPATRVAVCESRVEGCKRLLQTPAGTEPQVIVLDDAYQHRYIKAGLYLLLTDFSHLFTRDCVLPVGRLRESRSGAKRADAVIVTKCPEQLGEEERAGIRREIARYTDAPAFFSSVGYGAPQPGFAETLEWQSAGKARHVLLVCGIARPEPFIARWKAQAEKVEVMRYPDHHAFTPEEVRQMAEAAEEASIIVTTEKDMMRLKTLPLPLEMKKKLYYQPIEITFSNSEKQKFNNLILNYVASHSRNRRVD